MRPNHANAYRNTSGRGLKKMVDFSLILGFNGEPLIIPVMALFAGVAIYLVARSLDQLAQTAERQKDKRRIRLKEEEKELERKKALKVKTRRTVKK